MPAAGSGIAALALAAHIYRVLGPEMWSRGLASGVLDMIGWSFWLWLGALVLSLLTNCLLCTAL
jgi:hypothetical protein